MCYTATDFRPNLYHRIDKGIYLESIEEGEAAMRGPLYSAQDLEEYTGISISTNGNGKNGHSAKSKIEIQPFYVYEVNKISKNGNGSSNSSEQILYGLSVYQKK